MPAWIFGLSRQNDILRVNPLGLLFFPFLIFIYVSYPYLTPVPWLAKRELLMGCQGMVVFWVALYNMRSKSCLRFLLIFLVVLAFISVIIAYYQYFADSDWLPMDKLIIYNLSGRLLEGNIQGERIRIKAGPTASFSVQNSLPVTLCTQLTGIGYQDLIFL